jgi:hypothetical protein
MPQSCLRAKRQKDKDFTFLRPGTLSAAARRVCTVDESIGSRCAVMGDIAAACLGRSCDRKLAPPGIRCCCSLMVRYVAFKNVLSCCIGKVAKKTARLFMSKNKGGNGTTAETRKRDLTRTDPGWFSLVNILSTRLSRGETRSRVVSRAFAMG